MAYGLAIDYISLMLLGVFINGRLPGVGFSTPSQGMLKRFPLLANKYGFPNGADECCAHAGRLRRS